MIEAHFSIIPILYYIKLLFIYSLKLALRNPKHCSCSVPLINYILHNKTMLDCKFICRISY